MVPLWLVFFRSDIINDCVLRRFIHLINSYFYLLRITFSRVKRFFYIIRVYTWTDNSFIIWYIPFWSIWKFLFTFVRDNINLWSHEETLYTCLGRPILVVLVSTWFVVVISWHILTVDIWSWVVVVLRVTWVRVYLASGTMWYQTWYFVIQNP